MNTPVLGDQAEGDLTISSVASSPSALRELREFVALKQGSQSKALRVLGPFYSWPPTSQCLGGEGHSWGQVEKNS